MKTIVSYPIPLDTEDVWFLFKPFVQRFCDTWRKFPPGADCELLAVLNNGENTNELMEMFDGLPVTWTRYDGAGADIGSFQHAAKMRPDCFQVCCVSRVYFHREGWLKRMAEVRELYGPGIYGTSASKEGGSLHVCTRCYAMDTNIINEYPVAIVSRDQGTFWEIGRDNPLGSVGDWVWSKGLQRQIVYWEGCYNLENALDPENIFRKGDQSACLVWDKHTQLWQAANLAEQERLANECFGNSATVDPSLKSGSSSAATEC